MGLLFYPQGLPTHPSCGYDMCTMKKCGTCGKVKPPSEFHRNPAARDGLRPNCKKCRTLMARLKPQIPTVSPKGEQLMTVKEVAEKLGVYHGTVRTWIRSGDGLKVIRFGTGRQPHIRIASDDLDAWLARPDY